MRGFLGIIFKYRVLKQMSIINQSCLSPFLKREMTCHFMGLADVVELGLGGRLDAYFRPAQRLVHRAAWGKPAAAVGTVEIKYTPVGRLAL